jgi:hypothetical protein
MWGQISGSSRFSSKEDGGGRISRRCSSKATSTSIEIGDLLLEPCLEAIIVQYNLGCPPVTKGLAFLIDISNHLHNGKS